MGSYDIMTDRSENVTLFQLMDYLANLNHSISVDGYWIFESNHKRARVLHIESLDLICAPSVVEEQVAKFETLFTAARYIFLYAHLKKE